MNVAYTIDATLMGIFAFATVHYTIQWWLSRRERILLVFAIQCALYSAFTWTMLSRRSATTVSDAQLALDRNVTLGLLVYVVLLHLYALLGNRRDRMFRLIASGVLVSLALLNQWVSLRGTVIELRSVQVPGIGMTLLPIRTPPGLPLALLYATVLVVQIYGIIVARTVWRRGDRAGAILIVLAAAIVEATGLLGILVDFAGLQAPHIGALPHAFFVVCMSVFLAREYSARAARELVANRYFETIFEHAPIGMALLAADGTVLRANHALCDILGSSTDELGSVRLQDLTHPHDNGLTHVISGLLAGTDKIHTSECSLRGEDANEAWVLLALSAVPDAHGHPSRVLAQVQDVTELRAHRDRLEELVTTRTQELREATNEARRANAAKSDFLAHVSHEIRTPLGVMMLYAQIVQRDPALGDAQRKRIENVVSNGKHLSTLLNDVLEMSRIEAGRAKLVEGTFDVSDTLDEIEGMFVVQTTRAGIELTLERAADLQRSLFGDGGKVKQILINLVGNAVKFTKRGTIRISASSRPHGSDELLVTIVVADSGIGIAPADLERVFQPFEQAPAGARAGGTGLGLAISLKYARLMGGDITAQSAPDVGTTVTFTFIAKRVVAPEATPPPEHSPAVRPVAKHCKVLIVDDLQQNRDVLAELLAHPPYETRIAADGPRALEIHGDWLPDLVLMDLRMPDMDGFEAIRRMRDAGSTAAIGVISASALPGDESAALAVGADFFMRKPYDERELFDQIAHVINRRDVSTCR
jgi:PAS domain S-box-containing protein